MRVNFTRMLKTLSKWAVRHQPEIMHAMGFAAGASALVLTATGTVKAVKDVEEKLPETAKTVEKVKVAAKHYIPAIACATASVAFHTIGIKTYINRNAMLASWGTMMYDRLTTLENKNREVLGEKKSQQIQDAIAQDEIKKIDPSTAIDTGHGHCLFIDELNGQLIRSSNDYIQNLVNDFNKAIVNQLALERGERPKGECYYPTVYHWETCMGERETNFNTQKGWFDGDLIRVNISYDKHESGEPVGYIHHVTMPVPHPNRIHVYGYS